MNVHVLTDPIDESKVPHSRKVYQDNDNIDKFNQLTLQLL